MEKRYGNQEGANNGDKHPFLKGDPFERLVEHTSQHKLIPEGEKQQLLANHEAAKAEQADFEKMDVRDQITKMKNGRSIYDKLRDAVERITGN